MHDLSHFALEDMIESSRQLRTAGQDACSMQDAASRIVNYLYDCFQVGATGERCCALVRCFSTHSFANLPTPLQRIARYTLAESDPSPAMRCLVLLATRGDHPGWNSPHTSVAHQVIPLPSSRVVQETPMIARLIVQMGLEIKHVIHPKPAFHFDFASRAFNIFHVEEAVGSVYVPAQETFVLPYSVRSVLGFGGILPSGEIFAVVLFAKVSIAPETAELFRTLALSVKLALLPFAGGQVFNQ